MPQPRKKAEMPENGRPTGRLSRRAGGMPTDFLLRRADAFGRAMNRKGMPMTWGVGKEVRSDSAWKRDERYRKANEILRPSKRG